MLRSLKISHVPIILEDLSRSLSRVSKSRLYCNPWYTKTHVAIALSRHYSYENFSVRAYKCNAFRCVRTTIKSTLVRTRRAGENERSMNFLKFSQRGNTL